MSGASVARHSRDVLAWAGALADSRGERLALVGGSVRDPLMNRPLEDLDLALEGDAINFARSLGIHLGVLPVFNERFGTASLKIPQGGAIDVAMTRRERYARPGALPEVRPAPLEEDLARRDFTVNAMARVWRDGRLGRVLDPLGGLADLEARRLRVLHQDSFVDDPTRILRGIEFEARLGLRFDRVTLRWGREMVRSGGLTALSGARLLAGVRRAIARPGHVAAIGRRATVLGIWQAIEPRLRPDARVSSRWTHLARAYVTLQGATPDVPPEPWRPFLLCWALAGDAAARRRLAARLGLQGGAARRLTEGAHRVRRWERTLRRADLHPGRVDQLLREARPEELWALLASTSTCCRGWALRALTEFSAFQLSIGGNDLRASGKVAPRQIGARLRAARAARLDGRIARSQEFAFALRQRGAR